MVARGFYNLREGVFRVSMPGVDVFSAAQNQLIVDERVLYPQILQSVFLPFTPANPNPTVAIPNRGFVPNVFAFGRYSGEDNRSFPAAASYHTDGSFQNHFFYMAYVDLVAVSFPYPTFLRGAQLILTRP